jgi:hypothetical protein
MGFAPALEFAGALGFADALALGEALGFGAGVAAATRSARIMLAQTNKSVLAGFMEGSFRVGFGFRDAGLGENAV